MTYNLRIVTWNANGLAQKMQELEAFLHNEKIDICLISETHLTKQSFAKKIFGYSAYHSFHPFNVARGGASVLIKNAILHYEDNKIELEAMQVSSVRVQTRNKEINVSAIYCPPRYNLSKNDFLDLFKSFSCNFIIGGDYNAKHLYWGSRLTTPKGKILYEAGSEANCEFYSSGKPTYWPTDSNKAPDLIDFFVVKGLSNNYIKVDESNDLSSDHTPIILTISETVIQKETPPRLTTIKTDWENFRAELEDCIELQVPIKTPDQLENEIERFIINIQQAAWNNTPARKGTISNSGLNYLFEIRQLVSVKRKARKKWQQSRAPQDKTILNRLSNQLKEKIVEVKNQTISSHLENLTAGKDTDYSLWKAMKGLKRPKFQAPPIRKADNGWARSDKEKADIFAEHLQEIFQPFPRQSADENINQPPKVDNIVIEQVSFKELKQLIKNNLSNKKAPGYDLITGQLIKELPDKAIHKFLHLINAAFRLKYVPRQWKIAEIIMIQKPGKNMHDKESYRPISLLPIMSKVFEKMLLKRLKPIIEKRKLIPNHQFGFRNSHSTIEQVHRITDIIEEALEKRKICSGIFLDVSQAFDKVWHKGLIFKLRQALPKDFCEILESYLSDRLFRIKHGNEYSDFKEIKAGVPQGSILGPTLYLLYTRDIPQDPNAIMATFADDTAIMAVGNSVKEATYKLQQAADRVNNWTKKWRIQLNGSKSTHVNFTYKKVQNILVQINKQIIPYANEAKYLGMTLDAKLKWKEHVKKKKEELNIKYRKMYWLLGRHSELSMHNKLLIYKQVLKPVWTYGLQLWGCTKKSNTKIIQSFQIKVLRGIIAPWYVQNDNIHKDLNIDLVNEVIKQSAVRYEQRLLNHGNALVQHFLVHDRVERRLKRTKPSDLVK